MTNIEDRWDKGDFTQLAPVVDPYPACIVAHFSTMISALREEENELGIGDHLVYEENAQHAKGWENGAMERRKMSSSLADAAAAESKTSSASSNSPPAASE